MEYYCIFPNIRLCPASNEKTLPYIMLSYIFPPRSFCGEGLFNHAMSSDHIVSNDRMNNELERIWKEAVMA
jgi:hypothetical protein